MAKPNQARAKETVVLSDREKRMEAAMAKAIRELKREGEFKTSRSAVVQAPSVTASPESLDELKAVLKELRTELRMPISQLFTA